jgi:hypothetical protein
MKKRLVKATENSDNVFSLFKNDVSVEEISNELNDLYSAWNDASNDNQQMDDLQFSSVDAWFDNFYTSIVDDLIVKAKEDFEFKDKYNNLSTDEQNELKEDIQNYILNLKSDVVENLQSNNDEENN